MQLRATTSAAARPATPVAGSGNDIANLFRAPKPMPAMGARIADVVRQVRAAKGPVVLWVPGTSCDGPTPEFVAALRHRLPGATIVTVPYQATWRMQQSVPDGIAVVGGVLDALRGAGMKVLVAGESQGAWAIGEALAARGNGAPVIAAALLEHPGVAAHQYRDPAAAKAAIPVLELDGADDLVSQLIPQAERNRVIGLVDDVAHKRVCDTLAGFLLLVSHDPALFVGLIKSQMFRVNGTKSPHDSGSRVDAAANFLARQWQQRGSEPRNSTPG